MKHFILDALNIIHASKTWSRVLKNDMQASIALLINAVEGYAVRYPSYRFTIVVDGAPLRLPGTRPSIIIMNANTPNADQKIKELIRQSHSPSSLTVVSTDTEVFNYARINAAHAVTSEEFLKLIAPISIAKASSKNTAPIQEKPAGVSRKEIERWKREFGDGEELA